MISFPHICFGWYEYLPLIWFITFYCLLSRYIFPSLWFLRCGYLSENRLLSRTEHYLSPTFQGLALSLVTQSCITKRPLCSRLIFVYRKFSLACLTQKSTLYSQNWQFSNFYCRCCNLHCIEAFFVFVCSFNMTKNPQRIRRFFLLLTWLPKRPRK